MNNNRKDNGSSVAWDGYKPKTESDTNRGYKPKPDTGNNNQGGKEKK